MFSRSAGSAVGVAVFGAIANATLGGAQGEDVAPAALTTAVHSVFLATTLVAGAMLAAVLLMPRDRGRNVAPVRDAAEAPAGWPRSDVVDGQVPGLALDHADGDDGHQ